MKLITSEEINNLYKKVHLDTEKNSFINTNLNKGNLNNKLIGSEALLRNQYALKMQNKKMF